MAKTSRDARRHIREWSKFFSDLNRATDAVVEAFIKERERRKHLRQTLNRLIEKGYLKSSDGVLEPTPSGVKFFRRHNVLTQPKKLLNDGKWYILSFDIPVKLNTQRTALARILKKYDFYPLQRSVWVGPHALAKDVWDFIVDQKLEGFCAPMIVDILEGDTQLRRHFGIK